MDGTDLLIGEWINIDHQDKELWQGATSLLIEYYVTDEIDSADWKLDFTTSVDDTQSVVTFQNLYLHHQVVTHVKNILVRFLYLYQVRAMLYLNFHAQSNKRSVCIN